MLRLTGAGIAEERRSPRNCQSAFFMNLPSARTRPARHRPDPDLRRASAGYSANTHVEVC